MAKPVQRFSVQVLGAALDSLVMAAGVLVKQRSVFYMNLYSTKSGKSDGRLLSAIDG